ncbi:KDO2-lipid IV(A) lauroyltransferase [Comamonas sp. 4034]
MSHLPLSVLRGIGWSLGRILFYLVPSRRKIALRNLELCFPEASLAQRRAWVNESFVVFCQTWLDRSWLWFAPQKTVEKRTRMTGALEELEGDTPTIMFAPHFYGMDAGGTALTIYCNRPFTSIFSTQPNADVDAWIRQGRQRFGDVRMLNRDDGVKPIIASLRKDHGLLYLLPDMDFGPSDSLFVPYFGQVAATIPSLSRFAKLGRAKVIGMYTRLTPAGYEVTISPAWQNFPTDDVVADTTRQNRELEAQIRTMVPQYYWVHKRFKTRPEGEASVYS